MKKLGIGLFLVLLFFCSSVSFSQDVPVDQADRESLLEKLKMNLLQALKDKENLQRLLNEKEDLLQLLNQSTGGLSEELKIYKNQLIQDISDLRKELKGNESLLKDLQLSMDSREMQLNQLETNLQNLSSSLTDYFRSQTQRMIRIVFIVGGITISITAIGIILLLAFA